MKPALSLLCLLAIGITACGPIALPPIQHSPTPANTFTPTPKSFAAGPGNLPTKQAQATATSTATQPATELRFAVIGDYGLAGESLQAVSDLVHSWQPEFIITTGDNNYPLGESSTIDENIGQYFHDFISPYYGNYGAGADTTRFFPSMGNHDWYSENALAYSQYFSLPGNERYYNVRWAELEFFVLDDDWAEPHGNELVSAQAQWLQQALANSTAAWKIVVTHHPPYSSDDRQQLLVNRWPYKEWGADLLLAGHNHLYERLVVDDLLILVNGLGGASIYDIGERVSGSQFVYNGNYGAMLVTATATQIQLQFITIKGELIDTVTLHK